MTATSRPGPIDWRWALPRILVVFLVTRLLVLAVAFTVETTQPPPPEDVIVDARPILTSLTSWDARYYTSIAQDGYHADPSSGPDYAFYPGYPIAIRALSPLTLGDVGLAAVLVANGAFLLLLVALYALSVRYLERERAMLALWFFGLAPGAVAYGLAYSESVFVLCLVLAFLAMERRQAWLAGIALALATLTRVPGILFGLPLLMLLVSQDGYRPTRRWLPFLLAPAVLLGHYAVLWWVTGDPLAAVSAQSYWHSDPVMDETGALVAGAAPTTAFGSEHLALGVAPPWMMLLWLGVLGFYTFLLVYFRPDRIRLPYATVAVLAIATVFLSTSWMSSPRFLAVAWPFAWVLANRRSRWGRGTVLAAFALVQIVLLWLAFSWQVAP